MDNFLNFIVLWLATPTYCERIRVGKSPYCRMWSATPRIAIHNIEYLFILNQVLDTSILDTKKRPYKNSANSYGRKRE